jgi:hypothetical protein
MKIAIDFDGTCVAYNFPNIGADIGAVPVLKELVAAGHKLILWTVRGDDYLAPAVEWFKQNGIPLYGINKNPGQSRWSSSPKAHAELYIDDYALFAATIFNPDISEKPYLDWTRVREELVKRGIITEGGLQ